MAQHPVPSRFRDRLPGHLLFLLQVILVLLWVFPQYLEPGPWGQWLGRWHPLLVHFPIAFLLLLAAGWFFRRFLGDQDRSASLFRPLLWVSAMLATLTALTGYSLGSGEAYPDDLLNRHRHIGTLTAVLAAALWWIFPRKESPHSERPTTTWPFSALMVSAVLALVIAGHYGGSLTHGEGYLLPAQEQPLSARQVSDSTPVFEAAIQPILESKCYGCHNPGKQKGGLDMTAVDKLLKGGKHGELWVAGNPLASLMVQRAMLDENDKKHMPPRGKPQLSPDELGLIRYWIERGADTKIRFTDLAEIDSLRQMATALIPDRYKQATTARVYTFPAPDPAVLDKLQHPYRSILPTYQGSTAYAVSFFLPQYYQSSLLDDCLPLAANIVALNLARMPVNDSIWSSISRFRELEQVNLSGTAVSGKGIEALQGLTKLQVLTLTDTRIDPSALTVLTRLPALTKVYVARTGADSTALQRLAKANPRISWIAGEAPSSTEMLQLTSPQLSVPDKRIFSGEDMLTLTHPMKGVQIRYRTDGIDADSVASPLFAGPIRVDRPMQVSARAVMDGWLASPVRNFQVYPAGIRPIAQQLLSDPDPRYRAQGAESLVDRQTGEAGNLMVNWLGYRQSVMKLVVRVPDNQKIHRLILSTALNTYSYVFPPEQVQVRLAADSGRWLAEAKLRPSQPTKHQPVGNLPLTLALPEGNWKYLEITVVPLPALPAWHDGRKQKGWVFVDEIIID